ncbi:MAG: hypothetical protein M1416_02610 [Candidatus Pacearchaeota archaeon]|nr:hypothetical protein [Candidatus Pacearchaeota archaeon]
MEKQRRKIVYNCVFGKYEVLKPKNGNGWYAEGEKKTLHGLDELLKQDEFNFEMSEEISETIETYRTERERRTKYFTSKII